MAQAHCVLHDCSKIPKMEWLSLGSKKMDDVKVTNIRNWIVNI